MEQQHVFHGLRYGEKEQRSLLSDQIVGVNSKLLQEALQSLEQPAKRQVSVNESYFDYDTFTLTHPHKKKKEILCLLLTLPNVFSYLLLFDSYSRVVEILRFGHNYSFLAKLK